MMDEAQAKIVVDKTIGQVFGFQNPLSMEEVLQKFAFDVSLPQQVVDSLTGDPTWAQSTNPTKFISFKNIIEQPEGTWDRPKKPLNSIEDILTAWNDINEMATERHLDSINIGQSDNIYGSENIYRSQDIHNSKNIVFCDSIMVQSEYMLACQRSNSSTFCIRIEDSSKCSNSFNVQWCSNIVNSFFISDASDLQDCMFCSHIKSRRFMIANMQFEEAEYRKIKDMVVRWILTN